ncbi:hypothetical protein F5877DRAFT_70815 [Lentinula edodes]|nr:hypothetical protein F5877DRAFT_70815 [Lentinula edodes]
MRRSLPKLQRLFNKRQTRRISDADGAGYLYAYVNDNEWKIGTTNDFFRRQKEWDKSCPDISRLWLPPIEVANRRRAESLAHLMLEVACINRPRAYCHLCRRKHVEKFLFTQSWTVAWITIIEPILLTAATA